MATAPFSSIQSSIRSTHMPLEKAHLGKISPQAAAVIAAAAVFAGVGTIVFDFIYTIYQKFYNEPHKQKELLEEACLESTTKSTRNMKNEKVLSYIVNGNYSVTYTDRADGLYMKKSGCKEEKHELKDISELQERRRQDLLTRAEHYATIFPEDLKPLLKEAVLHSKLSLHDAGTSDPDLIGELTNTYPLTHEDIGAAFECLQNTRKSSPDLRTNGLHLLELAMLHSTLSKVGTADISESDLVSFMDTYNLTSSDWQTKFAEFKVTHKLGDNFSKAKLVEFGRLREAENRENFKDDRSPIPYAEAREFKEEHFSAALKEEDYVELFAIFNSSRDDVVSVETLQTLPKLDPEEVEFMLAVEAEKLKPKNALQQQSAFPNGVVDGFVDKREVNRAIEAKANDIYRPNDPYSKGSYFNPDLAQIYKEPDSLDSKHDENRKALGEVLNAGDYEPGTLFSMLGYSPTTQTIRFVHPLAFYAVAHFYKDPDPDKQVLSVGTNNPAILRERIAVYQKYLQQKDKIDPLLLEVHRTNNNTFNIKVGNSKKATGVSRNIFVAITR